MNLILIYLTCANDLEAEKISTHLLNKKLIACSKRMPVKSASWWEGKIESGEEILAIFETTENKFEEIEKEVKKLHSYDLFVMTAIPIVKANKGVEEWIKNQ